MKMEQAYCWVILSRLFFSDYFTYGVSNFKTNFLNVSLQ